MKKEISIPTDIPAMWGHCTNSDCKVADTCLRQLAMRQDSGSDVWIRILNPNLAIGEENCPYYVDVETPRYARGVSFNFDEVPYKNVQDFKAELQVTFNKMRLSRMKRGLCLISPKEQKVLQRLCAKYEIPMPIYQEFTFSWDD